MVLIHGTIDCTRFWIDITEQPFRLLLKYSIGERGGREGVGGAGRQIMEKEYQWKIYHI